MIIQSEESGDCYSIFWVLEPSEVGLFKLKLVIYYEDGFWELVENTSVCNYKNTSTFQGELFLPFDKLEILGEKKKIFFWII